MNNNKVQISIDVDTLKGIREISKLQLEMQGLSKEADIFRKQADKASKALEKFTIADRNAGNAKWVEAHKKYYDAINQYTQLTDKVQNYNKAIDFQVSKLGLAGLSMRELNKYIAEQNTAFNKAKRGSDEYMLALDKLGKAETERNLRNKDRSEAIGVLSSAKNSHSSSIGSVVGHSVGFMAANFAADMLFETIGKVTEKVTETVEGISNLKIAIKGTTEEALALDAQIAKLDNRLDQTERRSIAIEAANLGVPTSQVVAYTQAIAEAAIAMKKDFPEGSEQITNSFTKIKGLFKDTKDLEFPESVRAIGSSIKGLADDGIATAKWASDFTLRLGALDEKIRPTITQVLGLGAVLEQSGFTSEIAASGVQAVLSNAFKNTEMLSKFFGMSKKAFEEFINANPNEFLLQLAQRLKSLSGTQQIQVLKALGNDSQEVSKVLGTLNKKIDEVTVSQAKANQYFQEGSRLTEIYGEKNENLAGKMQRAFAKIGNAITNSKIVEQLKNIAGGLADLGMRIVDTSTKSEKLAQSFNKQSKESKANEGKLNDLVYKYTELSSKQNVSAESQKELNKVINSIRDVVPGAVTEYDKFGNAISVNVGIINEFIRRQKEANELMKNQTVSSINEETNSLGGKRAGILNRMNLLQNYVKNNPGSNAVYGPELAILSKKLADINKQIVENKKRAAEFNEVVNIAPKNNPKVNPSGKTQKELDDEANAQAIIDGKSKEAKSQAERDAEARKENAQRLQEELGQIDINAIQKDSDRREAQIRYDFKKKDDAEKALVRKNQLDQSEYLRWREKAYDDMLRSVAQNDKETNDKIAKEVAEVNTKALLRKLELHKEGLEAELEMAKAKGNLQAIFEAEVNLNVANEEIALAKATEEEKLSIQSNFSKLRLALHDKFLADREQKDQKDRVNEIDKKTEVIKAEENARQELFQKMQIWANQISQVTNAFFDFQAQQYQNQLTREDNLFNKKIANLEAQKNKGIISEREYTRKKTAFETEHDKKTREIKNKAAQADKVARIAQAVMTTAQAIINAFAVGKDPITIAALSATAGIVGALQIATIAGTEVPQYYDGGDTHKYDGPGIDGKGGKVSITHPNEFMLNARATANPKFAAIKPILQSLNRGTDLPISSVSTVTNNQSTVNQSPDSAIILKAAEMIVESATMLAEASQNLKADIVWDYNTHRDLDRSRKKYEKSNANSFVES